MAFPDRWIQFWTHTPRVPYPPGAAPAARYYICNWYWYAISGATISSQADADDAAQTITGYYAAAFLTADIPLVPHAQTVCYIRDAGVTWYTVTDMSFGLSQNSILPMTTAAVVQRQTDNPGRSGKGRYYISGIKQDYATGCNLNALGQSKMNALAASINTTIPWLGRSFTPSLVSYSTSTLTPIVRSQALPLLGCVHRRRRERNYEFFNDLYPIHSPPV